MKKLIFVLSIFFVFGLSSYSQIKFQKLSPAKAFEKAKKENKLVFIDVYADWCRPCKMLDAQVFSNTDLAKFFNRKFICIKFDGDSDDGNVFMQKHELDAFPTMLFMNSNGEVVRKVVGLVEIEKLLNEAKYAIDPSSSPENIVLKTYIENPSRENHSQLIQTLFEADLPYRDYCDLFFEKYPILDLSKIPEFLVFYYCDHDVNSENFKNFLSENDDISPDLVKDKIDVTIGMHLYNAINQKDIKIVLDVIDSLFPTLEKIDPDSQKEDLILLVNELYNEKVGN